MPEQESTTINLCVSCYHVIAALLTGPAVIRFFPTLHIGIIYISFYNGIIILLSTDLFFCGRKAASQTN